MKPLDVHSVVYEDEKRTLGVDSGANDVEVYN